MRSRNLRFLLRRRHSQLLIRPAKPAEWRSLSGFLPGHRRSDRDCFYEHGSRESCASLSSSISPPAGPFTDSHLGATDEGPEESRNTCRSAQGHAGETPSNRGSEVKRGTSSGVVSGDHWVRKMSRTRPDRGIRSFFRRFSLACDEPPGVYSCKHVSHRKSWIRIAL